MFTEQREAFNWRRVKRNKHEVGICTRLLFGVMLVATTVSSALALPSGGTVIGGTLDAPISYTATTVDVDQNSQRVDIDWTSFDTTAAETVNFAQTATQVAINRVANGVPTQFDGALNAGGRVFVINRNGVTFGAGSQINVGALLATTSDTPVSGELSDFVFSDADFSGAEVGNDVTNPQQVINNGTITVSNGGFAVLAAPYVENSDTGMIRANYGQIEMASTEGYTLAIGMRGDGLITFTAPESVSDELQLGVTNSGTLSAKSGYVYLSANMATEIVSGVINLSGVVDADQFASGDDGGTIIVSSVGDITLGDADIHAIGGDSVEARFDASGSITSADDTSATIHLDATGDGYGGYANASLRMTAGEDITITTGDGVDGITVAADPVSGSSSGYGYASANANAHISGDNIDISGDITVTADAGVSGYDGTANANAYLYVDAGDLTVDGDVLVEADAYSEESGSHYGGAIARVNFNGDDIAIKGAVTVEADATTDSASGFGGDASAEANLYVNATEDLTVEGDIAVSARADGGSYYGRADADARADLRAADDVTITGDTEVVAVAVNLSPEEGPGGTEGTGDTEGPSYYSYGYTADADAYLYVTAGNDGYGGDLEITGDVTVTATAESDGVGSYYYGSPDMMYYMGGSSDGDAANAMAYANLSAANDVTITTDASTIRVEALAINDVENADYRKSVDADAVADAELRISAGGAYMSDDGGDITISGNTEVIATALREGDDDSDASASAELYMNGDGIDITGDVTVKSDAENTAMSGESADAYTYVDISANEDLTISGDVLISAEALVGTSGTDTASADTYAYLSAGGDLTLVGDTQVLANATHEGTEDNAEAYAYLGANAGGGGRKYKRPPPGIGVGDLSITGDVLVSARSTLGTAAGSVNDSDADAHATASADIGATGSVTINGGETAVRVEAISLNQAETPETADAYASLDIYAGDSGEEAGTVEIEGGIEVVADADRLNSGSAYGGYYYGSGDQDAVAEASLEVTAPGDITLNGPVTVRATADNVDGGGYGGYYGPPMPYYDDGYGGSGSSSGYGGYAEVRADAELDIVAGYRAEEQADLNITGDVEVTAEATMHSGDEAGSRASADARSGAVLLASGNQTVVGNVDVTANAKSATADWDEAYANAGLLMLAGATGLHGDLDASRVLGEMDGLLTVDQLGEMLGDDERKDAIYFQNGDLHYTGDITVTANAEADPEEDGYAQSVALAALLGGDDVDIITDPVRVRSSADTSVRGESDDESQAEASAALLIVAGLAEDEDPSNLFIRGDVSAEADVSGSGFSPEYLNAFGITALAAENEVTIRGEDPLARANTALVQQRESGYQLCDADGVCADVEPGILVDEEEGYGGTLAQLIIEGESVSIEPDTTKIVEPEPTPEIIDMLAALDAQGALPDVAPGALPLRFAANGDLLPATGVGVTEPPPIQPFSLEAFIAAGGDPTQFPTAARPGSGSGGGEGQDGYTISAKGFCDDLVSGGCLADGEER